jgi:hypothetical protein
MYSYIETANITIDVTHAACFEHVLDSRGLFWQPKFWQPKSLTVFVAKSVPKREVPTKKRY